MTATMARLNILVTITNYISTKNNYLCQQKIKWQAENINIGPCRIILDTCLFFFNITWLLIRLETTPLLQASMLQIPPTRKEMNGKMKQYSVASFHCSVYAGQRHIFS